MTAIEELSSKRLCFSVTSRRSRTKLLATLVRDCAGLLAEHEPAPRFNQNPRQALLEGGVESALPLDLDAEEAAVERRIAELRGCD